MRVLFVAPGEPIAPDYSGASSRYYQNFAALSRLADTVAVVRLCVDPHTPPTLIPTQDILLPPVPQQSRLQRWPLAVLDPLNSAFHLDRATTAALAAQIERSQPDLIWIERTALAAFMLNIAPPIPWIVSLHDLIYHVAQIRYGSASPARRLEQWTFRRAEARVLRGVMSVTASYGDAARGKALGAQAIEVIPMAYDSILPPPAATEHAGAPLYIAHLGSVETTANRVGLEAYLRKVQPHLPADAPPLWIIGADRQLKEPLRSLLRAAELKGFVPDLTSVLRPFNLAILPYEQDSGYRTKLPVLFDHAQVVVTTRAAVSGMWIEGLDRVCVVLDRLEEFPAALRRLSADPQERERLGRAAHAFYAEHFTLDAVLDQYRRLLNGLLR